MLMVEDNKLPWSVLRAWKEIAAEDDSGGDDSGGEDDNNNNNNNNNDDGNDDSDNDSAIEKLQKQIEEMKKNHKSELDKYRTKVGHLNKKIEEMEQENMTEEEKLEAEKQKLEDEKQQLKLDRLDARKEKQVAKKKLDERLAEYIQINSDMTEAEVEIAVDELKTVEDAIRDDIIKELEKNGSIVDSGGDNDNSKAGSLGKELAGMSKATNESAQEGQKHYFGDN